MKVALEPTPASVHPALPLPASALTRGLPPCRLLTTRTNSLAAGGVVEVDTYSLSPAAS